MCSALTLHLPAEELFAQSSASFKGARKVFLEHTLAAALTGSVVNTAAPFKLAGIMHERSLTCHSGLLVNRA
jgi:hypothetical protein